MNETAASAPLSNTIRIGWAIGEFAIACHMAILSIFLLYYLTEVHHFPPALAGTLILIPRLWNVITDPLMGGISDRVKSRWGRRRPFLLVGATVWGLGYAAMFWIPEHWSLFQKGAWFLVTCLTVNTGLSLYHVPYSAMVPEMTRSKAERVTLVGYKEVAARASVLVTVVASPLLVAAAPSPLIGHRWVGLVAGALILASGLVAFFATAKAPAGEFQPQNLSLGEQFRTFRANRPLFWLSGAYLMSSASDAFYSAMLIYFITVVLQLDGGLMGTLYPVGSVTAMVMTIAWATFGKRMGRRLACQLAFAGAGAVFALSLMIPAGQAWAMIPYMVVLGAFMAGVFLLPGAILPDTVEYDEAISGQRREGIIYGAWIFTQQTGMAFGAFLVGIYLDLSGYQSGSAAAGAAGGALAVKLGFALVPAAMLVLGALLLRPLKALSATSEKSLAANALPQDGQKA